MFESKRLPKTSPIHFAALFGAVLLVLACGKAMADDCFDGDKAFDHVRAMVEIGPRPSGSPGIIKTQEYLLNELALPGVEVREQQFVASTPLGSVDMKNILAVIPGTTRDIIIMGAHYDTKLFKDFEFVGANDSGSGTAVLLELARCFSTRENEPTIWLAFFDGEEALVKWSSTDGLYGSRHMAGRLFRTGDLAKVKAMILLDMVGDRDLSIEWETNSTSWLRKIVWSSAGKFRYGEYFTSKARRITDDHVPFLSYGIPSIDIIDFHYGPKSRTNEYWHTPEDTLDKVSPTSLKIIGDVVIESIDPIMERVRREALGLPPPE
jgi:Zn-dependent M28 family amino/carboxypeptidase